MPAYLIIDIVVHDQATYADYVERARPIVERYGGRYLVRGGKVLSLSGGWNPQRVVLIEFLSTAELQSCFASEDYKAIAPLRERSTTSRAIVVEGMS